MALVAAAGASTAVVCATAPGSSGISSPSPRRISYSPAPAGGRKIVALSQQNVRSGARWGVERSSFLGDFSSSLGSELRLERAHFFDTALAVDGEWKATKRQIAARSFGGYQGRRGGGMFFVPLGPARGGENRGSFARKEWERRQRGQQERLREIIEREIQARSGMKDEKKSRGTRRSDNRSSSYEFSLLQELERRLRAEEEKAGAVEDARKASDKSEAVHEKEKDGKSTEFGASTYELMKELEKRLRAEKQGQSETPESSIGETEPGERRGRRFMTGNYSSLYDLMKEWNQETRERRARLEEQWNARMGSSVRREQRTKVEEEEELGREEGRRKRPERRSERSERSEHGRRDNTSGQAVGDDADANSVAGPKYPQSDGTVVYLKNEANGAEIYLVGTSHVSSKSVEEVREVINRVKPDFVMVELCRKRYEGMKRSRGQEGRNPMAFMEQMIQMLTNGNVGAVGKIIGVGLASFYKLLSYRGFHPGREFQVAIEEGKKVGAKIVLGDQDIEKTLNQLGQFNLRMSMEDAFKIFGQRMPDDIAQAVNESSSSGDSGDLFERMRNRKVVRRFNEEMEKGAPVVYKALMSDRNEEMLKALRNLKGKVVAVVGLAHMDGVEQLWHQANEKSMSSEE